MALTKKQKSKKAELHGELRSFLAMHNITKKTAAAFFDEEYWNFVECLRKGKYSIGKIQSFVDKKDELLTHINQ